MASAGMAGERTVFGDGPEKTFEYCVLKGTEDKIEVDMTEHRLSISVPALQIEDWAASNDVSISQTRILADGRTLSILIEKDLAL